MAGSNRSPVAHTSVGENALTAVSGLPPNEPGFGVGVSVQKVPSKCSANVLEVGPLGLSPTAQTSVGESALIPARMSLDPTLGLGATDQAEPVKCSISVLP